MKLETQTPHSAFLDGYVTRSAYPLQQGLYKLREVKHKLERLHRAVTEIEYHKAHNLRFPHVLACCMGHEAASWLKTIPITISRKLGYEILPAIRALTGDGLSSQKIASLKSDLKPIINSLLSDCEWTYHLIRKNIRHEYQNMKSGQSELAQELKDAIWLCDKALDLHEVNRKNSEIVC